MAARRFRSFRGASCVSWRSRSCSGRRSVGWSGRAEASRCGAASATPRRSRRPSSLRERVRRRDVPGGDATREGSAQEARRPCAHGRGQDRTHRRVSRSCPPPSPARTGCGNSRGSAWCTGRRSISTTCAGGLSDEVAQEATDRLMEAIYALEDSTDVKRPLLAVDGDSFAHRAYHALPSSIRRKDGGPGNTLVGFTTMLLRLWQAERPRAVVVGWDSIGVPDLQARAPARLPVGEGVRRRRSSSSSICSPDWSRRQGSSVGSRPGTKRTTSSARPQHRRSVVVGAPSSSRRIAMRSSLRAR